MRIARRHGNMDLRTTCQHELHLTYGPAEWENACRRCRLIAVAL